MQIVRFFITVTLLICYHTAPAQSGRAFHPGQKALLADFDLYRHILEKAHAGLYKYHTRQQVDSMFNDYRRRITPSTNLAAFYRYLSASLSWIGSLHDDVSLPESYLDSIVRLHTFFPWPVKVVDNQLLVNADSLPVPVGASILSINGEPVQTILPRLFKYYTTDGFNTTGKYTGISLDFPLFYFYEYGSTPKYVVTYRPYSQSATRSIALDAVAYKTYALRNAKRHSKALDTLLDDRYAFRIIDSLQTAVLTVNTFSLGSESTKKHAAYREFLRQSFTTLKQQHIQKLIVDIRKNGGGQDPNDLLTFSFLAHHPFKENKEAFTIFQDVPYKEYYYTDDSTDIPDTEDNFHKEHNQFRNGRYYQNPSYNPLWQPDSLAFTGKLYLLISPAVASAASLFASMVKSEGYATVIGEESMGGYYGHTGHNKVAYQLPHTKIDFSFAVVDLLQYVTTKQEIPFGRGILPDITVGQTQKDFIENRDAVMEAVLEKVIRDDPSGSR